MPQLGNPQALNRYAYTLNNPIRYTDPSGRYYVEDRPKSETGREWLLPAGNPFTGVPTMISAAAVEEADDPATTAEVLTVLSMPYVSAVAGVVGTAALAEGGWAIALRLMGPACADGDCGNEVEASRRVFWSGGQMAKNAAEAWARTNKAITLEMTEVGQRLERSTRGLDWFTQGRSQWADASKEFAKGAVGEVHVFHNSAGISLQSIWATVEYQALSANPNVTRIIYHIIMPNGSMAVMTP